MTAVQWREIEKLERGDRIEIGTSVIRVMRQVSHGIVGVRERDGKTVFVARDGDAFHTPDGRAVVRYVGAAGSDPLRRELAEVTD